MTTTNLIIGAGPAGLAIAGRFRKAGLAFLILEQSNQIATNWQNHYDRLHLHTVKQYSALPHAPFPTDFPKYIPRKKLVDYYENYAKQFSIEPLFEQEVISVKKEGDSWEVITQKGNSFQAKNVIICTGFNRIPNRPKLDGENLFTGEITHSRFYKNGASYTGKNVLVIGMGNTGAEIALDLLEHGAKPSISVRSPINIVPRDFLGRATQESAMLLSKLPQKWAYWLGKKVRDIAIGDLSKFGLQTPTIAPAKQLHQYAKTPVIDIGTIAEIKKGNIRVLPAVQQLFEQEIAFNNQEKHSFDSIILATGYRAKIEDFLAHTDGLFNDFHIPKKVVADAPHQGLFFLGFDAYSNGLLWSIHQDSALVLEKIIL